VASRSVYSVYQEIGDNGKDMLYMPHGKPGFLYDSPSKLKVPVFNEQDTSKYDMIAKDSSPKHNISMSKYEIKKNGGTQPHVFSNSALKSSLPGNICSHIPSKYPNSDFEIENRNNVASKVINENVLDNNKQSMHKQSSVTDHLSHANIQRYEREFVEVPQRFVEVSNQGNVERQLVSLPRHVERVLPLSVHPDLQLEEYSEKGENHIPRLTRNDSVGKTLQ